MDGHMDQWTDESSGGCTGGCGWPILPLLARTISVPSGLCCWTMASYADLVAVTHASSGP
eukprot:322277-Chlamydomonas_euryale.AAC.7